MSTTFEVYPRLAIIPPYGLIAASVAELTEGFIYSGDNAWDYERFPAQANEFFSWYFYPNLAIDPNNQEWATRNIQFLSEELACLNTH